MPDVQTSTNRKSQSIAGRRAMGSGSAIAREAERRDLGYGDNQVRVIMILENLKGETRERRLRISTLEVPGYGIDSS